MEIHPVQDGECSRRTAIGLISVATISLPFIVKSFLSGNEIPLERLSPEGTYVIPNTEIADLGSIQQLAVSLQSQDETVTTAGILNTLDRRHAGRILFPNDTNRQHLYDSESVGDYVFVVDGMGLLSSVRCDNPSELPQRFWGDDPNMTEKIRINKQGSKIALKGAVNIDPENVQVPTTGTGGVVVHTFNGEQPAVVLERDFSENETILSYDFDEAGTIWGVTKNFNSDPWNQAMSSWDATSGDRLSRLEYQGLLRLHNQPLNFRIGRFGSAFISEMDRLHVVSNFNSQVRNGEISVETYHHADTNPDIAIQPAQTLAAYDGGKGEIHIVSLSANRAYRLGKNQNNITNLGWAGNNTLVSASQTEVKIFQLAA